MQLCFAELTQAIQERRCADLGCPHDCNSCMPAACYFKNRPYWCEHCFAFVPDYPTFCHCGQRIIVISASASAHRR